MKHAVYVERERERERERARVAFHTKCIDIC